jgi:peptide/nickel transport system permease protein
VLRFLLSRIGNGILILWGVVTLLFFIFHALPSDPARMMLGQRSDISSELAIRKELGLDKPLMVQYFMYLNDLSPVGYFSGSDESAFQRKEEQGKMVQLIPFSDDSGIFLKAPWLRRSYQSQMTVSSMLKSAFPATALLAFVSIVLAFIIGVMLGAVSARYKGKLTDKLLMVSSVLGMSVPSFFASVLIAWLFAWVLGDYTGLNMFGSLYEADDLGRGEYISLKNLILPAFTLSIRPLAVFISLSRNSILEVQQSEYVRTAKAKGLSKNRIFMRHMLKNSLNPVVTSASGWFASLLAGAVFVEYVFDWKGIGYLVVQSLEKYDLPVLMGCLLIIAVMFVIINILLDLAYRALDPRVKL